MKIIKIGALWCPGCLLLRKNLSKVIPNYDNIEFIDLDYDMDREEVDKYNVDKKIPVTIFLSDSDEELSRYVGELSEEEIRNEIDKYV